MSKKSKGNAIKVVKNNPFKMAFQDMTYKDLKKMVVVRGLSFEEVVNGDFCRLQSWLHKNYDNKIDTSLLDEYDDWLDNNLRDLGKHELIHPSLRLGYIGEREDDEGNKVIKTKKAKVETKPKEKKEKTAEGIFSGTKKALTYSCQKEGKTIEKTIEIVMKQFPDASDKSIKIWYKKCKRENAK